MKKTLTLVAASLLALMASAGIASAAVSAQELQDMISAQLAQAGRAPDSVSCPGELATEVGAATTCQVTVGGQTHALTIAVSSVEGSTVNFSIDMAGS